MYVCAHVSFVWRLCDSTLVSQWTTVNRIRFCCCVSRPRSERIAVSLRCRARLFTHKRFLARVCACLAHAIIAERTFVVAIETKKFKLKSAAATRDTLKAVIKEKFAVSGKFSLAYVTDAGSNVPLPSLAADWPAGTVKLAVVAAESPALPLSSSGKHGA